jgi:hypothetical protein
LAYTQFRDFAIQVVGRNSICFDLNWDNIEPVPATSDNFDNMGFSGGSIGPTGGDIGVRIGWGGFMGSEISFDNCYFSNFQTYGLILGQANALNIRMMNCAALNCGIAAFYMRQGAIPVVINPSFAHNAVDFMSDTANLFTIIGARTESVNFVQSGQRDGTIALINCMHSGTSNGYFLNHNSRAMIDSCRSRTGHFEGHGGTLMIHNSYFKRFDFLDSWRGNEAHLQHVLVGLLASAYRNIIRQRWTNGTANKRTYDIEASSLSDGNFLYDGITDSAVTVTFTKGSADIQSLYNGSPPTDDGDGYIAGVPLTFTTTARLPSPLSVGTTYYVIAAGLTETTFRIATSPGGSAITMTSAGSGMHTPHTARFYQVGDQVLKNNVAAAGSPGWICTTAGPSLSDGTNLAVFKALPNVAA